MKHKKLTAVFLCILILLGTFAPQISFAATKNENDFKIENLSMGGGGAFFLPLINPTDSRNFIVASDMGGLYTSLDKGENWTRTETKGVIRDSAFSEDGTLFACGFGVYKSTDKCLSLERIYPKNIVYEISRYGWNENLFFTEPEEYGGYDNGYIACVEPFKDRLFFVSITWEGYLKVLSCDFNGDNLRTHFEKDYSKISSDPTGMNVRLCIDESGIYFSDMLEIRKLSFDSKDYSETVYTASGEIIEIIKIENKYFILDDIENETLILCSESFNSLENLNEQNTLKHTYTWDKEYTIPWRFVHIAGYDLDNIFLAVSTPVPGSYDFYGVIKFDGEQFNWVFDGVYETTITENSDDIWSSICYGPIYGLCADKTDPDHCLVSTIEAVHSMQFDRKESKRKIRTLHTRYDSATENYMTTGLDCQTTYSVQEDPFDKNHIIICSTDLGLQYSYDNGKTFNRPTKKRFSPEYNTCYDLYFDRNQKDVVYAVWSSRHDAPYAPALTDKTGVEGHFAVSYDGGKTWDMDYSFGLPEYSIPVKMSVVPNGDEFTVAVATFNCGFYISSDSGRTFESVSADMDNYNGFIWGEDVILSGNKMYCLTAYYNFGTPSASRLYEYNIETKQTKEIDLGNIVIARSLTEGKDGILINALPTYKYEWYNEYSSGFWKNTGGGIYRLNTDNTLTNIFDYKKTYTVDTFNRNDWPFELGGTVYNPGDRIYVENAVLEEGDSIYNSIVSDDGTIYATGINGTVYVRENGSEHFGVYVDGLFRMLKNLSLSSDGKTLYVTTFGGGTYRMPSLKALKNEPVTEPTTEPTTEPSPEQKPGDEPASCSHICHQGGISALFYQILRFFWRIFGTNQICACGAKHY